jgi:hypothetical protein
MAEINFSVDRNTIRSGECVTFHWKVEGVKAVYFYRDGERWKDHGVTGEERRQECPAQTTTYCLRVVKRNDSVDIRQITIQVQAGVGAPAIHRFSLEPAGPIQLSQCVQVRWRVEGNVQHVRINRRRKVLWDGAPVRGNMEDCPPKPGNIAYTIEATGPGGTSRAEQVLHVVEQPAPPRPPRPTPPPPPDKPEIRSFSVSPAQIKLGDCVTVSWDCGGATSWVTVVRGEHIVMDNAPLSGSAQDCPDTPGQVGYRIVAFNPEDERVRQDRTIQVIG